MSEAQKSEGLKPELEIDPRLLEALVCPVTRRPLTYDRAAQELVSPAAGLAFPIRSGVPIMLVDQARAFEPQKTV